MARVAAASPVIRFKNASPFFMVEVEQAEDERQNLHRSSERSMLRSREGRRETEDRSAQQGNHCGGKSLQGRPVTTRCNARSRPTEGGSVPRECSEERSADNSRSRVEGHSAKRRAYEVGNSSRERRALSCAGAGNETAEPDAMFKEVKNSRREEVIGMHGDRATRSTSSRGPGISGSKETEDTGEVESGGDKGRAKTANESSHGDKVKPHADEHEQSATAGARNTTDGGGGGGGGCEGSQTEHRTKQLMARLVLNGKRCLSWQAFIVPGKTYVFPAVGSIVLGGGGGDQKMYRAFGDALGGRQGASLEARVSFFLPMSRIFFTNMTDFCSPT